jgi:oxaloacetate decarboxylase alpha subunit
MTYLKGIEAGADVIDTATSIFSGGTSQPATETLFYALDQMGYEIDLDHDILKQVNDHFKPYFNESIEAGLLNPTVMGTATEALDYKIPGGMLSNLISQLKAQNAMDRFEEVLAETPRVREDMGYPPLVTPLSQMVGVQAATNVLLGERYKSVGKELKAYVKGEYGRPPGEIDPEIKKRILGKEKPIEGRPADFLEPEFEKTKKMLGDRATSEEDVLTYIAFPQVAEKFFAEREKRMQNIVKYTIEAME